MIQSQQSGTTSSEQLKSLLFELDISAGVTEDRRRTESAFKKALGDLPANEQKAFLTEYDKAYGTHYTDVFITEPDLPALTDQTLLPVCEFPLDVLPERFLKFTETVSEALSVEPHITAGTVLTIVSSAIGNTVRIAPKESQQVALFLWSAIVAKTGYGKSPLMSTLLKPIQRLQGKEYQAYKKALKEYEQAKAIKSKSNIITIHTEPKQKHFFISDHTVESLISIFESDPRGLLLYLDELSGLIQGLDQYKGKGNDRQHYLELFNCAPWQVDRKKDSRYASSTGAGIIGGIQPKTLPVVFGSDSLTDGLLPRFIFTFAGKPTLKFNIRDVNLAETTFWENALDYFYSIPLTLDEYGRIQPTILPLNNEALNLWEELHAEYDKILPFLSESAQGFVIKLVSYYSLKFAGVLHCLKAFLSGMSYNVPIDVQTMNGSIQLTHFYAGQVGRLLELYQGQQQTLNGQQQRLVDVIYDLQGKVQHGRLPLSEIHTAYNNGLSEALYLSHKKIASLLRAKPLNLTTQQGSGGFYYLIWDTDKMQTLFKSTSTKSTFLVGHVDFVDVVDVDSDKKVDGEVFKI